MKTPFQTGLMNAVSMLVSRFGSVGVIHWDFNVGQRPDPKNLLEQGAELKRAHLERNGFGWGV
jgi:hypothetical protein